jgi:hypothetical protein
MALLVRLQLSLACPSPLSLQGQGREVFNSKDSVHMSANVTFPG